MQRQNHSLLLTKGLFSFNKKQIKFNSYSEDYAVLFYIRLFDFCSGLLNEYFLKKNWSFGPLIMVLNNHVIKH